MIKIIATDMDGTLLNSKGEISEEFFEIFPKIIEKNIIFAAASGRQYYNLLKKFNKVKDKMMFIAENGIQLIQKVMMKEQLEKLRSIMKDMKQLKI